MNKKQLLLSLLFSSVFMNIQTKTHKTFIDLKKVRGMCADVCGKVKDDGFEPDLLVGITRGGLIPTGLLAGEKMFHNKNILTISVASYTDDHQRKDLILRAPVHFEDFKRFKNILLIDDIVDSGQTITFVLQLLKANLPDAIIKTVSLYYKPCSILVPDYFVEQTDDWIVFPWEN